MELIDLLKKFQNIEPDKDFARRSRSLILSSNRPIKLGFWQFVFSNVESGAALALAGFLIFMIIGGFSAWKTSPLQITSLDPTGLRAEARAIDIQIQLTNLNYQEGVSATKLSESTAATVANETADQKETATANGQEKSSTSTSAAPLSIDEALDRLSE